MPPAHEKIRDLVALRKAMELAVDPKTTALLIVDMQQYFLTNDSPYSRLLNGRVPGYTENLLGRVENLVLPNLKKLVERFRAFGGKVFWTTLASELPDGSDLSAPMKRLNQVAAQQGLGAAIPWKMEESAEISPQLDPRPEEMVINKTTFGAFASTGFGGLLAAQGITTLIIGGIVTNVCVEATAREAVDRGLEVFLAEDACGAYSPEVHEASLFSFQSVFGQVRSTKALLEIFPTGRSP